MSTEGSPTLERWLKIVGIAITLAGIFVGAYQFTRTQSVSAARPFLERKLKWCEEAVEVAAGIAVYGRGSTILAEGGAPAVRRIDRFWVLYWGAMGMVENQDVTDAMVAFGTALKSDASTSDPRLALAIAHACRSEMARDWSPIWSR
jgi:hypothetical protein